MQDPLISIVVPSFNQAQYLAETLQSLVDQNYLRLEVIVQDGLSTDSSGDIARDFERRFPEIFRVFVEKDGGQADALNRGFGKVHGDVLGFLNSDDTLLPGTLERVAREIDPSKGRSVVMGRSVFTGVGSRYVGIEHPARYVSHFDHLAIWKRGFNTIPQPSVFWHRDVWTKCGGFNTSEHHVLDYDLFCRFSKYFYFHRIDALFSTYRMHDASKSSQRTEAEVLALSVKVSRRYWGAWYSPLRWRCEFSYWRYTRHFHEQARHHARKAEEYFRNRRYLKAFGQFLLCALNAPGMALERLLKAWIFVKTVSLLERVLVDNAQPEFTGRYSDGWIGPHFREELAVGPGQTYLTLSLWYESKLRFGGSATIELFIDGKSVDIRVLKESGAVTLAGPIDAKGKEAITIDVRCNRFFVPASDGTSLDTRRLALLLKEVKLGN